MPSTRAQASAEKHPQQDSHPAPDNHTMTDEPALWCLTEMERAGEMHPDAYDDEPEPKSLKSNNDVNPRKRKESTS